MEQDDRGKRLLGDIGRRAIVAFVICGGFLLWAFQPTGARDAIMIVGALMLASAVMGLLLSWPKSVLVRALIIAVFACLLGMRGQLESSDPVRILITAIVTGLPAAFLFGVVAAGDWLLVRIWRKVFTRSSAAAVK